MRGKQLFDPEENTRADALSRYRLGEEGGSIGVRLPRQIESGKGTVQEAADER